MGRSDGVPKRKSTRTQHVPYIDDNGPRLRRQGRKDIAHGETGVRLPAGANFEPVLAVALEEERQAANVGMAAGPPSPGCVLRRGVVEQTELRQTVWFGRVVGLDEEGLWEAEGCG